MPCKNAPWWRTFFESPDSFPLASFPDDRTTEKQLEGLRTLLALQPGEILGDICCGYGRHIIPLAAEGHCVVGLDVSAMMLDVAQYLADEAEVDVPLVQGYGQALPFADGAFDVVTNLFNSMGYMEPAENRAMLMEMSRVLKPGGRLVLDTRNKKYQILYAPYHSEMRMSDGRLSVLRCRYDSENSRLDSEWSNPEDADDVYYTASIQLYSPSELEEMLAAAGLTIQGRYSDYDGSTFVGFERQLIYLCSKQ